MTQASVVHVLFADPATLLRGDARVGACLDTADREHVARFRFARDREVAMASRILQRLALSRAAMDPDLGPETLRFAADASGRPHVVAPASMRPWQFSASNTIGLVACAVFAHGRIGMDVERMRDEVPEDLVAHCCTPGERAELARCHGRERSARFTALWARKEAYLKARGIGLALAPSTIGFSRGPGNNLRIVDAEEEGADDWQVIPLDAGNDHAAALCLPSSACPPAIELAWAYWHDDRIAFAATRP